MKKHGRVTPGLTPEQRTEVKKMIEERLALLMEEIKSMISAKSA